MKHTGHKQFWEQVETGKWEPETFKVLGNYCKPGKDFIDIGAWNGVCSLFASEFKAQCHAIEPDPEAFKYLTKNIKLNHADIKTHQLCIGAFDGVVNLNTQYDKGFGNSMSSVLERGLVVDSVEVKSMTLESFIHSNGIDIDNVSLIKIDIEGGEIGLLKQAKGYLKLHEPTIYLSLHPMWFPNLDEDTQLIGDIIFDIYRVFDVTGREYERWEFLSAVNSNVHSFILKK